MTAQGKAIDQNLDASGRMNRTMYRVTGILGLTTGIGVIGWGIWSLLASIATFAYEESTVLPVEEILINNGLNEGMLLSGVVIALGVIILELKKVQTLIRVDIETRTGQSLDV